MQHASGIITVVQEGRFRLATEDGRSLLFTLDHRAPLEPQDLGQFVHRGPVTVAFTLPAHRKALTAHEIHLENHA